MGPLAQNPKEGQQYRVSSPFSQPLIFVVGHSTHLPLSPRKPRMVFGTQVSLVWEGNTVLDPFWLVVEGTTPSGLFCALFFWGGGP